MGRRELLMFYLPVFRSSEDPLEKRKFTKQFAKEFAKEDKQLCR